MNHDEAGLRNAQPIGRLLHTIVARGERLMRQDVGKRILRLNRVKEAGL